MKSTFWMTAQEAENEINSRQLANASVERYDYENQAWTVNWHYMACNHPATMNCKCFGKLHAGEFAEAFKERTLSAVAKDKTPEVKFGPCGPPQHLKEKLNALVSAVADRPSET